MSKLFDGLVRWNMERMGTTLLVPICYYDNLSMSAVFTASTSKVRRLIPHKELHPIELIPGRCLVAFSAFEFRRLEGEPYNEVSISFVVNHSRRPIPFFTLMNKLRARIYTTYVWQLPVTTHCALTGGIYLFGLPKFLADIQITKEEERVICVLSVSGVEILRLVGSTLPTKPGRQLRYVSYAVVGDNLVSSNNIVNCLEYAESHAKGSAELTIGESHPICASLRDIGLAKFPMLYQYSPHNESILCPPRNVKDE